MVLQSYCLVRTWPHWLLTQYIWRVFLEQCRSECFMLHLNRKIAMKPTLTVVWWWQEEEEFQPLCCSHGLLIFLAIGWPEARASEFGIYILNVSRTVRTVGSAGSPGPGFMWNVKVFCYSEGWAKKGVMVTKYEHNQRHFMWTRL